MKLKICSNRLKYREQSWMVAFTLYCLQWGWLKICQVLIDKRHVLNFLIKFDRDCKWISWYKKLTEICVDGFRKINLFNLFWTPLTGVECWSSLLSVVQSSRPARSAPALWAKHIHWLLYIWTWLCQTCIITRLLTVFLGKRNCVTNIRTHDHELMKKMLMK